MLPVQGCVTVRLAEIKNRVDLMVLHRPNRIQISRTSELVAAQREAPQVGQLLQLGWDCACTHGTFLN